MKKLCRVAGDRLTYMIGILIKKAFNLKRTAAQIFQGVAFNEHDIDMLL